MEWGHTAKLVGAAVALIASMSSSRAQIALPPIDVNWTRLNSGMVGTSTSIITSQDIESSPAQNLPDILSQQVGIQVQHLLSSTNGSRDTVDLRGFGVFAQSNVLMLVNGRRFQDFDLQGFDFSSIP
ncbi:MAG: Plug domain-containing protein, partial [Pseudolabrys sp.]